MEKICGTTRKSNWNELEKQRTVFMYLQPWNCLQDTRISPLRIPCSVKEVGFDDVFAIGIQKKP